MDWWRLFAIFAGFFSIWCAGWDYDWFMNNGRAAPFVYLFGRAGARIFYVLLGLFIVVGSLFLV